MFESDKKVSSLVTVAGVLATALALGCSAGVKATNTTGTAGSTGTAAARRVGFGVKIDSLQDLTIEGFKLLMAAIQWLAAAP